MGENICILFVNKRVVVFVCFFLIGPQIHRTYCRVAHSFHVVFTGNVELCPAIAA